MKKVLFVLPIVSLSLFSCTKSGWFKDYCPTKSDSTGVKEKTIVMQPGPSDGQDCSVAFRETDKGIVASTNYNGLPNLNAARWSWNSAGAGEGTERGYIKFTGLDSLPKNAIITSAKLSLYGVDSSVELRSGNYGDNNTWLRRVTGNWDQTAITWNNKPNTTDTNMVALPVSQSQWNFDVTDIDVTSLVKDMVASNKNYGFCLQLETEDTYRAIIFGTSEVTNAARRPKLVVTYKN